MSRLVTYIMLAILALTCIAGLFNGAVSVAIDIVTSLLLWVVIGMGLRKCNTTFIAALCFVFISFWAAQLAQNDPMKEVTTFLACVSLCLIYRYSVLSILLAGLALIQVIYRIHWPFTTFIGEIAITAVLIYAVISLYTRRRHDRFSKNNL